MAGKTYMNRMGQRQAANKARRTFKRGSRGMKSSILRMYREKIPSAPQRWQLRRPAEPYPHFSDPNLVSDEYQFLMYSVKKGGKFRTFPVNPDQDLIDVYRDPNRLVAGADPEDPNAERKYAHLLQSEAAQQAIAEHGPWIESDINPPDSMYGVEFYILDWYHLVTLKKQGNDIVYTKNPGKDDKTWRERELCSGRGCKLCQDDWPKVFGKRGWHDFSFGRWWGVIDPQREVMERWPKEGGYVYPLYYQCPNEACVDDNGTRNIMRIVHNDVPVDLDIALACQKCGAQADPEDPDSDPLLIDEDKHMVECSECGNRSPLLAQDDPDGLKIILQHTHTCQHCGEEGYPEAVYEHMWTEQDEDPGAETLQEWTNYDLFDHTLTLYKEGKEGRHQFHITEAELSPEPDPKLFDPQFQGAGVLDDKTVEREIERMKEHLDLSKALEPTDPSDVAEFLEVPNLYDSEVSGEQKRRVAWKSKK